MRNLSSIAMRFLAIVYKSQMTPMPRLRSSFMFMLLMTLLFSVTAENLISPVVESVIPNSVEMCKKTLSQNLSPYHSMMGCLMCLNSGSGIIQGNNNLRVRSITPTAPQILSDSKSVTENKVAFDKIYSDLTWSAAGGGSG
jgi:hypothetical protein